MDTTAMVQAWAESDDSFRQQFDRSSPNYHAGIDTPVPIGGARVPESMVSGAAADCRELPEAQPAIEPEYPPAYHETMAIYEKLNQVKKAIATLNKPVEAAMKVRLQYKAATGDDQVALESRLKGEENVRDGALNAAKAIMDGIAQSDVSDRTRNAVDEVVERGRFEFIDRDTFGEYMTTLQRCNQAIFADQKKLLQKIKDIKKAAQAATAAPKQTA